MANKASRNERRCHRDWMMTFKKQLLRPASLDRPLTSLSLSYSSWSPSQVTPPALVIFRLSPAPEARWAITPLQSDILEGDCKAR